MHVGSDHFVEVICVVCQSVSELYRHVVTWAYAAISEAGPLSVFEELRVGNTPLGICFSHAFADAWAVKVSERLVVMALPEYVIGGGPGSFSLGGCRYLLWQGLRLATCLGIADFH